MSTYRHALVFANGELQDGPAVQMALSCATDALIVAADGGALLAQTLSITPHLVVGDMDSLAPEELAAFDSQGVEVRRYAAAKDETDLELALIAAVDAGVQSIRVIGALGRRIDHTLANIYLLTLPRLQGRDVRVVSGRQTLWLIGPGEHTLEGAAGDTISLVPLGEDAAGVRTTGLRYPLRDETLAVGPARGISNVMLAERASVALAAGRLIVVHTPGRA